MKQESHNDHELVSNMDTVDIMKLFPELAEQVGKPQSTPLGNYYTFTIATDSTCTIEWGNRQINKTSTRVYYFSEAERLKIDWENEDFLVLRGGRGSDAWFNVFLPLDSEGKDEVIENVLTQDKKRNLVVAEYSSLDTVLIVRNLESKEIQSLVETDKCSSAFPHYCIDTIAFTDKGLYYIWTLPNKLDDHPIKTERTIEIKI
jgi:hypothetical protein